MEENVALDSSKQKKFVKTIKKLIKKQDSGNLQVNNQQLENLVKTSKKKRPERGLVYLSHIPHGFYENQMTQYFKQFGAVTNVRVIRSKRTGNSKGYAFVEFKEPAVAEIVAETMNNYLMGKRIIKAVLIPPEKQRHNAMRKHWNRVHNPGMEARLKMKKAYNENKDDKDELKRAKKIINNLNKTKSKLSALGISYEFFTPVDVPDALSPLLLNEEDKKAKNLDKKQEIKKKNEKITKVMPKNDNVKSDKTKTSKAEMIDKKQNGKGSQAKVDKKTEKAENTSIKVDKKLQKSKNEKLKQAGVLPAENFIKLQDSDSDGSSLDFDSDEFEKMMGDESDVDSAGGDDSNSEGDVSEDDENESGAESDDNDESDDEPTPPTKKGKDKKVAIVVPPSYKQKPQRKQNEGKKRKLPQKQVADSKKSKFEKQTQQPMKKQFKKKK